MSSFLFHSKVTPLNLQGYGIAFAGVCWFNWTKLKALSDAPAAVEMKVNPNTVLKDDDVENLI